MNVPAQAERADLSFLYLFVLFGPSMDWMTPTTLRKVMVFTQSMDSNANLFQKHPHTHTTPKIMFYQLSGYLLAQ